MIVNLTIKTIDRKIYPVDINNQYTIYDLKTLLITKYNFINMELTLILDGKILNNQTIIDNIDITNEKYIILLLKKIRSTPNIDSTNPVITNSNNTISSINSNQLETISPSSPIDVVNILENTQSTVIEYADESIINGTSNTADTNISENYNNEIVTNSLDIEIENNETTTTNELEIVDVENNETNTTTNELEIVEVENNETILERLRNEILNYSNNIEINQDDITYLLDYMGIMDPSLVNSAFIDNLTQLINSTEFTELDDNPDLNNNNTLNIDLGDNPDLNNNNTLDDSLNRADNNIDNSNMTTSIQPVTEVERNVISPIPVEEPELDEELEEYVDTFISLLDNSPDLLGLLVQRQRNINIASILASKLDYLDYDLALYVIQNNNKFFQRVYEIMNGFDRGTTKREDIFGSNRNNGTAIEEMFQSILNGTGSIELPPPQQETPEPVVQQIQISDEQNIVLDRLSEFFPNTDRLVLYEALTVCDNNEELAINYLFDNN